MKALYVKELKGEDRKVIEQGLRSASAFTVRRSQILLLSADEKLKPAEIGKHLKCSDQCVRETLHAYEVEGVGCLQTKSRARQQPQATFDEAGRGWLQEVVKQSPRNFGLEQSIWTLEALAEVAHQRGYSERVVRPETVGRALKQAGITWQRAKAWIQSPDPQYATKKNDATG